MKLTTFILLISLMQVSAATFGQRVTLKQNNLTIDKVFREIRKQTGYDVLMGYGDFKASKINANFDNASLTEVMDVIVKNTGLTYSIEEKTIVIKRKSPNFLDRISERLNAIDVSGRVVDTDGRGLPGASVSVKGKGKSVSTDANGNFYLKGVSEDAVLLISFIGYVPKEVKATKELGNIVMEISNSKLDEVQVIAYGTTTRRLSTSNIGTIKADVIDRQPVSNPLLALQGRIPGIEFTQTSGVPGSGVTVRIQGQNSLRNGNEAFYVIDGVPYLPQNLYSGINGASIPNTGSTLAFINPSDIESVDFLKDADATAIYGSRAANGAILITTKKGKAGQTKVDLNMQTGWGRATRDINLLNTQEYLDMRKDAFKNNNNASVGPTDYDINGEWDQNRNVDWQKELIGGTAQYRNMQGTVSGGNLQTQFLIGGGYNRETTVYPGDFYDNKANFHFNLNHTSVNQRFKINLTSGYIRSNNKVVNDLTQAAISLAPNAPQLFNDDGSINWAPLKTNPNSFSFTDNPAGSLLRPYKSQTGNLISNALLSYEILQGLSIKSSLGYNQLEMDEVQTNPQASFNPTITNNTRSTLFGNKSIESLIIEPQITYKKVFPFGQFDVLVGTTFQRSKNLVDAFEGRGYTNDSQLENPKSATTITPNFYTMRSDYRYTALFGRINYTYKDRYIFNGTLRRDGSSRFGSENMFHSFFSVGGAWQFAEEEFFKKNNSFLNYGKLRITYGTTGNDQIPDYQFLNLYDSSIPQVTIPYQGTTGLIPTGHSNPYLQWEETKKLNFGIDLGFFNNSILLNANFYRNRSSNQLIVTPLPSATGFPVILNNIPAVIQNSGWEFLIDASLLKKNAFKWSTSFNLTIPRNKLISYPNLQDSPFSDTYVVGQPINIEKVYKSSGVSSQTGLYEFIQGSGQLTSSPDYFSDRIGLVNTATKFYGGFSNTFIYKGFQFDILLQYVKKLGRINKFGGGIPGFAIGNEPTTYLDRWKNEGDNASIQKVSTGFDPFTPFFAVFNSDANYGDASFVRLKNASLSYNLPQNWSRKAKLNKARVYIQGQNLFTITNFVGSDPETLTPSVLSPLRVISLGIQLTL